MAARPVHGGRARCSAAGSAADTALRFGARLIRPLLVAISLGLTARLLWGYFALR